MQANFFLEFTKTYELLLLHIINLSEFYLQTLFLRGFKALHLKACACIFERNYATVNFFVGEDLMLTALF